jgi:hypothetical protein
MIIDKGRKIARNTLIGLLAIAGLVKGGLAYLDSNYLEPKDFETAQWIPYNNPSGRIWTPYMSENIPKNQANWHLYIDLVTQRNNGNLTGEIKLPDLDGNREVGRR